MAVSPAQVHTVPQGALEHDRRAVFSFASLQSATGQAMVARWGGNPEDLSSRARVVTKSDAAYRIFGRYEQCPVPRAEYRSRFVDDAGGAR